MQTQNRTTASEREDAYNIRRQRSRPLYLPSVGAPLWRANWPDVYSWSGQYFHSEFRFVTAASLRTDCVQFYIPTKRCSPQPGAPTSPGLTIVVDPEQTTRKRNRSVTRRSTPAARAESQQTPMDVINVLICEGKRTSADRCIPAEDLAVR